MENNNFNYKYSAPTEKERREIESIRRQYLSEEREPGTLERLKSLHKSIKRSAVIPSVFLGVFGTLVFGSGLTVTLEMQELLIGTVIMAVGLIPTALAYPLYKAILKSKKKKHSEEIVRLSDELLG